MGESLSKKRFLACWVASSKDVLEAIEEPVLWQGGHNSVLLDDPIYNIRLEYRPPFARLVLWMEGQIQGGKIHLP